MPALETSTSTGPNRSSTAAKAASTCVGLGDVAARGRGAPSVRAGRLGAGEVKAHPVAAGHEPVDAGGADAPRAPGDQHDPTGHVAGRPRRPPRSLRPRSRPASQSSGWPSCTRSPAVACQRTTSPANGVRTSTAPTRPIRSPTAITDEGPPADGGAREQAGAGRAQGLLGEEDPAARAHHDPLGHVEVLADWCWASAPLALGRRHRVHQACRGRRAPPPRPSPRSGTDRRARPLSTPPGPELDEGGPAEAGQGLERLAPPHRAAQLGREEPRPLGRVDVDAGVDVRDHRDLGRAEHRVAERLAQGRRGRRPSAGCGRRPRPGSA